MPRKRVMKLTELKVGNNEFISWGSRTYVMGIINVTPDSFSGDGIYLNSEKALTQALQFVQDGADFLDIGAESTRPQHVPVSDTEELDRIMPVILRLLEEIPLPLSIDTSKSSVALEALKAGAHMINDVTGLNGDPNMAHILSDWDCPIVIMHNSNGYDYKEIKSEVRNALENSVHRALSAGVQPENIIIDPGIGFGKTPDDNLVLINELQSINPAGYPTLIGTSRKSTIGHILGTSVGNRLEGTAATVAISIARGVDIVRVHDVSQMKRVCTMTDSITRSWRPENWTNP